GIWQQRYRSIIDHEAHLQANGTKVVKLFLHISKEEQRQRLLDRIEEEDKNWKFNAADLDEREHWEDYMGAFSDCLSATSTADAPWYIRPADDKKNARLYGSAILLEALQDLDPQFPGVTSEQEELLSQG